jgi:hypothetical protein
MGKSPLVKSIPQFLAQPLWSPEALNDLYIALRSMPPASIEALVVSIHESE